jgi:hypothetical protein
LRIRMIKFIRGCDSTRGSEKIRLHFDQEEV